MGSIRPTLPAGLPHALVAVALLVSMAAPAADPSGDRSVVSAAHWHDRGVTEWQRDRQGAAMLAWERAVWLDPGFEGSRRNLDHARRVRRVAPPPLAWWEALSTHLPGEAWAWIASLGFWIAVVSGTWSGRRIREEAGIRGPIGSARWPQMLAATGFSIVLLALPPLAGAHSRARWGLALQENTPLRLTPTREGQVVARLRSGEPARLLRTRGDRSRVRTLDGTEGWLESDQFGLVGARSGTLPDGPPDVPQSQPGPARPGRGVAGADLVARVAPAPALASTSAPVAPTPTATRLAAGPSRSLVRRVGELPAAASSRTVSPRPGAAEAESEIPDPLTDQTQP